MMMMMMIRAVLNGDVKYTQNQVEHEHDIFSIFRQYEAT